MELQTGIYESLIYEALKKKLEALSNKLAGNQQAGVFSLNDINVELLWVTLNKSDKDFSPSTQYKDFAISESLFNWQSQHTANLWWIRSVVCGEFVRLFVANLFGAAEE